MTKVKFRTEKDTLGEVKVPAGAYWGAQTQRAVENFPVSGLRAHPALLRAYVMVKLAAARANRDLGKLDAKLADAIEKLRRGGEMDKAELKRLQTIAWAARNYINLLDSYENYEELEERIRSLEETAAWTAEHAEK